MNNKNNYSLIKHANDPSHHVVYLYNYTDTPCKNYADEILTRFYSVKKDGIMANEDVRQMSAWFVIKRLPHA